MAASCNGHDDERGRIGGPHAKQNRRQKSGQANGAGNAKQDSGQRELHRLTEN